MKSMCRPGRAIHELPLRGTHRSVRKNVGGSHIPDDPKMYALAKVGAEKPGGCKTPTGRINVMGVKNVGVAVLGDPRWVREILRAH